MLCPSCGAPTIQEPHENARIWCPLCNFEVKEEGDDGIVVDFGKLYRDWQASIPLRQPIILRKKGEPVNYEW